MSIKVNEADLLALLGDNGERWSKGEWGSDETLCLHGAIRRCSPQPGDAFIVEQVAEAQGWGARWNDSPATDWAAVRARIAAGIEVTDADLAATFGPQWLPIVALVRRAATLTSDEVALLGAAPDAAVDAARSAALVAVAEEGREDTLNAACGAVTDAAGDAACATARNVAFALTVRDLVGHHGFTQQHYDRLTEAWRTVVGPAHPLDEEDRGAVMADDLVTGRGEVEPRRVTLDDLFRIAYKHGGRVSLLVLGGHETRHVVSCKDLLYELESPTDRALLLELAS